MTFKMNLKWNLFGIFFCFFFFFFRWHLRMVFINFLHFFSIIEIWKFHQPVLPYIYCEHVLVLRIYYHTRIRKSIYIFFYYSDSYIHDWRWNSIFFSINQNKNLMKFFFIYSTLCIDMDRMNEFKYTYWILYLKNEKKKSHYLLFLCNTHYPH